MREGIILRCIDCKNENYISKRNKKQNTNKVEVKKYCSKCNSHIVHKEKK
ncbi:50S ribosomal protein L33 [Spiroplasma endosymbiont of Amphibalanus improvisus]